MRRHTAAWRAIWIGAALTLTGPAWAGTTPVQLAGAWSSCRGSLELRADGTWAYAAFFEACRAEGTWSVDGDGLSLVPSSATCQPRWVRRGLAFRLDGDVLELRHEALGAAVQRMSRGTMERQRWLLTNDRGERTEMFLCFTPGGAFLDGWYRAASPACRFLSCTGRVGDVQRKDGAWAVWTACGGQCPCAGVLSVAPTRDGHLEGVYGTGSCMGSDHGRVAGERLPFAPRPVR